RDVRNLGHARTDSSRSLSFCRMQWFISSRLARFAAPQAWAGFRGESALKAQCFQLFPAGMNCSATTRTKSRRASVPRELFRRWNGTGANGTRNRVQSPRRSVETDTSFSVVVLDRGLHRLQPNFMGGFKARAKNGRGAHLSKLVEFPFGPVRAFKINSE